MTETTLLKTISADSHVIEPSNLWETRLQNKYRDRAPHIFWDEKREGWFSTCDGLQPALVNNLYAVNQTPEEFAKKRYEGIEVARVGGVDPSERLKDMATDGVMAEVLYPSLAIQLFWLDDAGFQEDCFRVYNDWIAEFAAYAPKQLYGLGLISLWNIEHAVAELYRCQRIGLKGVCIWASPSKERAFTSTDMDPFWQAAQETNMSVNLHILTGYRSRKVFDYDSHVGRYQRNMAFPEELQHSLTDIIFSGVLERFPTLKIVTAENDIGWIAYYLLHADRNYIKLGVVSPTTLTMKPSEYFKRQVYATFMEDEVGIITIPYVGSKNFMWGGDYPHYESTWPNSQKILNEAFKHIDSSETHDIIYQNCANLYGIEL